MRRDISCALAAALFSIAPACLSSSEAPDSGPDTTWVGTITTEGNVTTVVNESGSVWGGTARLVEEASIGVELGDEPYMLGRVAGIAADDERIYVLDAQLPALRIYDFAGAHLFDIEPIGQGPGEFQDPDGFALAPDGALFVTDFNTGRRLVVFEPDGSPRSTVSVQGMYQARPYRVDGSGVATLLVGNEIAEVAPDGTVRSSRPRPQFDRNPWLVRTPAREGFSAASHPIPFAPAMVFAVLPTGAFASGPSTRYRIRVEDPGGATLVIDRDAGLVSVEPDEKAWHEHVFRVRVANWGAPEGTVPNTPDFKPAMSRIVGNADGSLWVLRPGPGIRHEGCADSADELQELYDRPCWTDSQRLETFGPEGKYLGEIELPDGFRLTPPPALDGHTVVAVVEDEAGTIMVKRYRLVLPGEEGR